MTEHRDESREERMTRREEERELAAEEARLRELFAEAGRRETVPEDDLEAVRAATRAAWREAVEAHRAASSPPSEASRPADDPRQPTGGPPLAWPRAAALAAALAFAAVVAWWWAAGSRPSTPPPAAPAVVAEIEAVSGFAERRVGESLHAGESVSSASGRLALRLAGGTAARLDRQSRLRLISPAVLELERGAVYLDTGSSTVADAARIEVRTPYGTARDIGTQFSVRLLDGGVTVRVREGAVVLGNNRADAGEELTLRDGGAVRRRAVPGHGDAWSWVLDAAPAFELEGRTVAEMLDWVARETGWTVRFASAGVEAVASEVVLHGSVGGLRADQVALAVLPSAGLEGELEDGVLVVRRSGS